MLVRKSALMLAVVAGFVFGARTPHAAPDLNHTSYVTFDKPVSLPGVALSSGTYVFELASPASNNNLVKVMNRERNRLYYLGFTREIVRSTNSNTQGQEIVFGEAAANVPPPITAWFPGGERDGHEFIYHR